MVRTVSIRRLGWLIVVLVAPVLLACGGTSDDGAAIRKLIDQATAMAEKQQIGDLLRLGTDDFRANPGNHDSNSVKAILFVTLRRYGRFSIIYPKPIVELHRDAVSASATLYFVILSKDHSLPGLRDFYDDPLRWLDEVRDKADPYHLQLTLVKQEGRWRVQQAHIESTVRRLLGGDPGAMGPSTAPHGLTGICCAAPL